MIVILNLYLTKKVENYKQANVWEWDEQQTREIDTETSNNGNRVVNHSLELYGRE